MKQLSTSYLKRVPDLDRIAKKLINRKATLRDCYLFFAFAKTLPTIKKMIHDQSTTSSLVQKHYVSPLEEIISSLDNYIALIEGTIDIDLAESQHEYMLKPSFDDQLLSYSEERQEILQEMESNWERVAKDLKVVKEKALKFEKSKQHGYYFRLSKKEEKHINGKKEYFTVDSLRKDGVKFRNSKLEKLNNRIFDISNAYDQKQSELVAQLIETVMTYLPIVEKCAELIADLDVIVSFAWVASHSPNGYVRPKLSPLGEGDIILTESRHPCLEVQDNMAFIPNDVTLTRGDKFILLMQDKSRFTIITGPNMGGKSTYIRQVGVIVLMAQIGSFVPCTSASISIVDTIMTRVGAADSQMRGLSTFMTEMLETAAILRVSNLFLSH